MYEKSKEKGKIDAHFLKASDLSNLSSYISNHTLLHSFTLSILAICIYRKPYKKSLNFLPNDIYTLNNIFKFIKSTSQKYSWGTTIH